MHITMVKKRLLNGDPCPKCAQTEEMLRRRGLWERIDDVVWAIEGDDESPGAKLGRRHAVERAPFFVVKDAGGAETVFASALQLIRAHLSQARPAATSQAEPARELDSHAAALAQRHPREILRWGLDRYGERCVVRFDGSDDVVLIDMAVQQGLPVAIFAVDSGRMRPETASFLDAVRDHYGVSIDVYLPEESAIADLVRRKGPNSFLRDGHAECCALRLVAPQQRALRKYEAWISGRRNDQRLPGTDALAVVAQDSEFEGAKGPLVRLNPLANWTRSQVLAYIEERKVPVNELHARGFVAIGCEPCTRPTRSDQPLADALWWWERPGPGPEPAPAPAGDGI